MTDEATTVAITMTVTHESGRVTEWRAPAIDLSKPSCGLAIDTNTAIKHVNLECSPYIHTVPLGIESLTIRIHGKPLPNKDGHWAFMTELAPRRPAAAICPESRDDKHRNCTREAWDDTTDAPTPCTCNCTADKQ